MWEVFVHSPTSNILLLDLEVEMWEVFVEEVWRYVKS